MSQFWEPAQLEAEEPRATRITARHDCLDLWMGGTHSVLGDPVDSETMRRGLVIDCSGELPESFRAAGAYLPRVFLDIEAIPAAYARLAGLVHRLVEEAQQPAGPEPLAVYVLCQQGLNRSGLVTGMFLRALGYGSEDAIRLIRLRRPGALSNQTFVRLVEEWTCPILDAPSPVPQV